jgi:hypothetical protein
MLMTKNTEQGTGNETQPPPPPQQFSALLPNDPSTQEQNHVHIWQSVTGEGGGGALHFFDMRIYVLCSLKYMISQKFD